MAPLALVFDGESSVQGTASRRGPPVVSPTSHSLAGTGDPADHRRRRALRGHVDAAGAHRRYSADLGDGASRGAEMLSLMMAFGIVSRLLSGWISDDIGGLRTLVLARCCRASPVAVSAVGRADVAVRGLGPVRPVPGRHHPELRPDRARVLPAREAGIRIAPRVTSTIAGMALGGWMSGIIYDQTGNYPAAFVNGIAWNAVDLIDRGWMLWRVSGSGGRRRQALPA